MTQTVTSTSHTFPLCLLMIVVSFVANSLVMVITRLEPKLRTASNRYICSLAMADFWVTFTTMVPFMLYNMHGEWPFGAVLCTLWVCCDFSLCTVSMLHLCLIALRQVQSHCQAAQFHQEAASQAHHPRDRSHLDSGLSGVESSHWHLPPCTGRSRRAGE